MSATNMAGHCPHSSSVKQPAETKSATMSQPFKRLNSDWAPSEGVLNPSMASSHSSKETIFTPGDHNHILTRLAQQRANLDKQFASSNGKTRTSSTFAASTAAEKAKAEGQVTLSTPFRWQKRFRFKDVSKKRYTGRMSSAGPGVAKAAYRAPPVARPKIDESWKEKEFHICIATNTPADTFKEFRKIDPSIDRFTLASPSQRVVTPEAIQYHLSAASRPSKRPLDTTRHDADIESQGTDVSNSSTRSFEHVDSPLSSLSRLNPRIASNSSVVVNASSRSERQNHTPSRASSPAKQRKLEEISRSRSLSCPVRPNNAAHQISPRFYPIIETVGAPAESNTSNDGTHFTPSESHNNQHLNSGNSRNGTTIVFPHEKFLAYKFFTGTQTTPPSPKLSAHFRELHTQISKPLLGSYSRPHSQRKQRMMDGYFGFGNQLSEFQLPNDATDGYGNSQDAQRNSGYSSSLLQNYSYPMNSTTSQNYSYPMNNTASQNYYPQVDNTAFQNYTYPMNNTALQNYSYPIDNTALQNHYSPIDNTAFHIPPPTPQVQNQTLHNPSPYQHYSQVNQDYFQNPIAPQQSQFQNYQMAAGSQHMLSHSHHYQMDPNPAMIPAAHQPYQPFTPPAESVETNNDDLMMVKHVVHLEQPTQTATPATTPRPQKATATTAAPKQTITNTTVPPGPPYTLKYETDGPNESRRRIFRDTAGAIHYDILKWAKAEEELGYLTQTSMITVIYGIDGVFKGNPLKLWVLVGKVKLAEEKREKKRAQEEKRRAEKERNHRIYLEDMEVLRKKSIALYNKKYREKKRQGQKAALKERQEREAREKAEAEAKAAEEELEDLEGWEGDLAEELRKVGSEDEEEPIESDVENELNGLEIMDGDTFLREQAAAAAREETNAREGSYDPLFDEAEAEAEESEESEAE